MGTDTAVLLLLADLQREVERLRTRVAELEGQLVGPVEAVDLGGEE